MHYHIPFKLFDTFREQNTPPELAIMIAEVYGVIDMLAIFKSNHGFTQIAWIAKQLETTAEKVQPAIDWLLQGGWITPKNDNPSQYRLNEGMELE